MRQIFISFAHMAMCLVSPAQQREKIDSLKKVLQAAKGIQRIDCLNSLGKEYLFSSPGTQFYDEKRDSSSLFSNQAYREAEDMHYVQGMAEAMFTKGKYAKDFREKEQAYLKAISFFEQSNNLDTLGQVYFRLGEALRVQANFQGSLAAYHRADQLFQQANDGFHRGVTLTFIGLVYGTSGDFASAFEYGYKALQVREKNKKQDPTGALWALCNIGRLFQEVEDYPAAIDYYYTKPRDYANANGVSCLHFRIIKMKLSN